jgi:hypothetical protein
LRHDFTSIPLDPAYASALGMAVYCFATLEWNAVLSCERLEAGSMENLEERTAGRVADTLVRLAKQLGKTKAESELQRAASDFRFLVGTRNNLVHAKPGSTSDGAKRLFRHGDPWTVTELEAVAEAFAGCSSRLSTALITLRHPGGDRPEAAGKQRGPGE